MGIKDFVLYYLNQNESEEFAKWAIGDNYKQFLEKIGQNFGTKDIVRIKNISIWKSNK